MRMFPTVCVSLLVCAAVCAQQDASAKTKNAKPSDTELVRRAVLDYVEALYEVAPERIERSVDKTLVKLGIARRSEKDPYRQLPMSYEQLHALAGRWNKSGKVGKDSVKKVEVLGVLPRIACAKLTAHWGIDYMQLHKHDGKWTIRHVLWQRAPKDGFELDAKSKKALVDAGLDYVEAFYQAKPARIERSVHEKLAKFGYYKPAGAARAQAMPMSFQQLRSLSASLFKDRKPPEDAPKKVRVLSAADQTAMLEVTGIWGVDYMHVARVDGKWKIVHVVWQSHPPKGVKQELLVANAVNEACPFSGRKIVEAGLTSYDGKVVGFCCSRCRDKFAKDPAKFPKVLELLKGE